MSDVYKDVTYKMDEESFRAAEYNDLVKKRFARGWMGLLDGFKVSL